MAAGEYGHKDDTHCAFVGSNSRLNMKVSEESNNKQQDAANNR